MFGEAQVSSADYTFTQSSNVASIAMAKGFAGYSANKAVSQFGQKNSSTESSVATKNSTSDNEIQQIKNDAKETVEETIKDDSEEDITIIYGKDSTPTTVAELQAAMGASSSRITKDELKDYLNSLTKSGQVSAASITVVKNLIAQFDSLSNGTEFLQTLGTKDAQDYKTVTAEQVTSPVDIRI